MAAGDELIDNFDNVLVRNRVSDAPVEVMFDGKVQIWKAGETRSIGRAVAESHFVRKSVVIADPTYQTPPVNKLVIVDLTGASVDPTLSAEPMTQADVDELAKYGCLDERNLPENRYVDDRGQPQNNRELRRVARGFDPVRRPSALPPMDELRPALDEIANSLIPDR